MITSSMLSLTKEQRLNLFLKNHPMWSVRSAIDEKLRERNKKRILKDAIRTRLILKLRFKYQKTFSQIAESIKPAITKQRIQQIIKKATKAYAVK